MSLSTSQATTSQTGVQALPRFSILAQSYTDSRRIARVMAARTEAEALRLVGPELEAAGFYALSATAVVGG